MKTTTTTKHTTTNKQRALRELKAMSQVLQGLVDEARVQVHLGTMELKAHAGPYFDEVVDASKAATKDLARRGRLLAAHLKALRAAHHRE